MYGILDCEIEFYYCKIIIECLMMFILIAVYYLVVSRENGLLESLDGACLDDTSDVCAIVPLDSCALFFCIGDARTSYTSFLS